MAMPTYPLFQVLEVKERRVEEQEKIVILKREALKNEEKKLADCEAARDKVLKHKQDKLQQFRDELDQGTTSDKIKQMKVYLDVVKEKLKIEEKKVDDQKKQVEAAKKDLEAAEQELRRRRVDVDKIKNHREDWKKEMRKEMDIIEGREQDEIGQVIFSRNHRNNS